jgi:large subunit ribosomal protein L19
MTHHLLQEIEIKNVKKIPVIRPGYSVRISQKIREGEKERVQTFEGLVLGINSGRGASKMITVRKMVEGIGVEKAFPIYSPIITKIEVTKTPKVRRAKLFYMRDLSGKATRLRTKVGMTAKDEKFSNRKSELLEGMGLKAGEAIVAPDENDIVPEAPATPAAEAPAKETKAA